MTHTLARSQRTVLAAPPVPRIDRLARRAVHRAATTIQRGRLTIRDGGRVDAFGPAGDSLQADLTIVDRRAYRRMLTGGGLGAAESYLRGEWTSSDLTTLLRLFVVNLQAADRLERGPVRLLRPLARAAHWLRRNTLRGSRRNIEAHYDLGNDFFELFLDDTMTYSCAMFPTPETSLRDASLHKLERVCQKLHLEGGEHVLEIGTGWGSFAIHAAGQHDCRVTTTTLSQQQLSRATARVAALGLNDRVTLLSSDYRDLEGQYDRLVSIEMIEAVGHAFMDTFFGQCARLLRPGGRMVLQAITMPDDRYERYLGSVDFIRQYVFPGSCLTSVGSMRASVARATDLRIEAIEPIGPHYATTLRLWREQFNENRSRIKALGYPERLLRMWEYYLCYCEAGFAEEYINTVQMELVRPGDGAPAS